MYYRFTALFVVLLVALSVSCAGTQSDLAQSRDTSGTYYLSAYPDATIPLAIYGAVDDGTSGSYEIMRIIEASDIVDNATWTDQYIYGTGPEGTGYHLLRIIDPGDIVNGAEYIHTFYVSGM